MQLLPTQRWSFARRTHGVSSELAAILELAKGTDLISLAGGLPDPQTFPVAVLQELVPRLLNGDAAVALQYSPTPGLPGLRDAFADRLETTQGRRPHTDELMVTSGTIDAIGLLARALLDPGDVAAVEQPTYLGAIDGFRGFEADVQGISVDEDGLDPEDLERLCRSSSPPKLLYTIPDHQNPTGITMSLERRSRLLEICRRHGVLVIEDVAYRELTFVAEPPSIAVVARSRHRRPGGHDVEDLLSGCSARVGGGAGGGDRANGRRQAELGPVRGGVRSAPARGVSARRSYGRAAPPVKCAVRATLRAHAGRARRAHAHRDHLDPSPAADSSSGSADRQWLDTVDLSRKARDAGVAFVPGRPFHPNGEGINTLRLAYSLAGEDDIDEGIARLAALITTALEKR